MSSTAYDYSIDSEDEYDEEESTDILELGPLQQPEYQQTEKPQHQVMEMNVEPVPVEPAPVNQPESEVHSVIGHTLIDRMIYYKIRWAPVGEWLDSWEPSNQCACDTIHMT